MKQLIDTIRTTYNHLSDRMIGYHQRMIDEIQYRKYMWFFKGTVIDINYKRYMRWPRAEVSLATACFHIGQGFGMVKGAISVLSSRIGSLRTAILNRLKLRRVSELKANLYRKK